MLSAGDWVLNQTNRITFVMVDTAGTEVAGLGTGFTLQLSKNGGAFAGSAGTKAEIGNGWYSYIATAGESDTAGPVAIRVTGAGAVQQNLVYGVSPSLVLSAAQLQALADAILKRGSSNVDGTAELGSIYELIQAILEGDTSSGNWVINETDGVTLFNTRQLATDPAALPIVGVSQ